MARTANFSKNHSDRIEYYTKLADQGKELVPRPQDLEDIKEYRQSLKLTRPKCEYEMFQVPDETLGVDKYMVEESDTNRRNIRNIFLDV